MAMITGTAQADGSGTGMAQALCNTLLTMSGVNVATQPQSAAQVVALAQALADALVPYITANAKVVVSAGGLQKLPTPATAGSATAAPDAPVELAVT